MTFGFRPSSWLGPIQTRTHLPTLVTFVAVLVASFLAEKQNLTIHDQSLRASVQHEASLIATRLQGQLSADIQLVQGLVAVLSTEPDMSQARFSKLAEQVLGDHKEIRILAAAPDLIVSLLYPVKGNEAVFGLDYNKNEAQREAAYRVRDSGEMVLAGPVNLVQGGRGFICRFPIFVGTGSDRKFIGIFSAVIDVDALYAGTGVTDPELGIELALIGHDGKGVTGAQFHGDSSIVEDNPVLADISFPVGNWQLAARPLGGWSVQPANLWSLRFALLVAGTVILFPTILSGRLSAARRSAIRTLKRRERELETLSWRLKVALESSKMGVWDFEPDSGSLIWDQQMCDLSGYSGEPGSLGLDVWWKCLHPDDLKTSSQFFEGALRDGGHYSEDFRVLHPNGDVRHIRGVGVSFMDADGKKRMIGVNWDVTRDMELRDELMRTNEALQHQNIELFDGQQALEQAHAELQKQQAELHRLSLVAKHASDSIILTDADRKIVWVNDGFTRVTGYSLGEAIGSTPKELLVGPKSDPTVMEHIAAHLARGERYHTEVLNYKKSGEEIWISTHLVPIFDDEGQVELVLGIERDVTGSKTRQRELAEAKIAAELADRAKSEFLANMSHEIRTPMNGIIGMAGLLAESDLGADEKQYVETIQDSSDALLKIINDILDLSRLEAGQFEISSTAFDLRHCVDRSVDLLRPKASEKGISVDVHYADGLVDRVLGDDGRVRQILVNLIGNAVKFTSEGSVTINVGADRDDPYRLLIEIEDSGIGISPDQAEHIFDRFSQADAAITRAFGGTGLGLTISSALAKRMGGDITLRSELGEGCCFTLCLQMSPAESDGKDADMAVVSPATMLSESRILLAEDNRVNRLLIHKYLNDQPLELVEAVNGREAVTLCQTHAPDIVLMDMSMPELDGIAATREIRALDIEQPTIVALTANAFESDREACLAAGMDHFLSKPINKSHLIDTLATLQAERRLGLS
ncbi:histidine kinase [Sedimentitalea sp. CY04]|uniref:histidine kinase n=1 Tax=Parasedimentitalea denitrificans TaxID=2211118 RepID=A0ABX0W4K8_9RHOB|nr:PAS domain-containing protein [Sedimentitalea sp. CY04]NIZ59749.1 histidine kinase [Sedimentitalea sp. CY04]